MHRIAIRLHCLVVAFLILGMVAIVPATASAADKKAKHVILFIGDGTGPEQIHCAHLYHGGDLSFEKFPHQASVTTRSTAPVTDSAAAATAIAAGVKVKNGVLSLEIPGDGSALKTMLEYFAEEGKATGLVTTDEMTQATPAAFGSHAPSRKNVADIAYQYLTHTRPNVMMGGGEAGMELADAQKAGYVTFSDATGMKDAVEKAMKMEEPRVCGLMGAGKFPYLHIDQSKPESERVYGTQFPYLKDMAKAALKVLEKDEDGLFVMIESALVDKSGHSQLLDEADPLRGRCNATEVIVLHEAVNAALEWARGRDDVLIVVTADHETGGLTLVEDKGKGEFPVVKWAHKQHTGVNVNVYAWGAGSEQFAKATDNTDVFKMIMKAAGVEVEQAVAAE